MDSDDDYSAAMPIHNAATGTSTRRAAAKTNMGNKDKTVKKVKEVNNDKNVKNVNTVKKGKQLKTTNMGNKDKKVNANNMGKKTNTAAASTVDTNNNEGTAGNIGKHKNNTHNDDLAFARKVGKRARRALSPEPPPEPAPGSGFLVGSDCAGYSSDFIAISLLGLDATLVFVAEMDAGKRELMRAAHTDIDFSKVIVYHDITKRDNTQAPYVDVFITGAPCQAWSQAGLKLGLEDTRHRGVVIFHSIEYVRCKRPRVVLIENVKGLMCGDHKPIFEDILGVLKDLGYTVEWRVVNTKDHGIPHSRPRLYIVAIRTRFLARSIVFPNRLHRSAALSLFIDGDDARPARECPTSKCFTEAMSKAETKHSKKMLSEMLVVIDTAASARYSTSMVGCVPCITKSRGRQLCFIKALLVLLTYQFAHYAISYSPRSLVDRSGGHWISKLNRHTSLFELAGLQGLPRCILDRMLETSQTHGDIGAAIGDAMSINVLMRLLPLALDSAGLLNEPCRDVWKDSAGVFGMMPDSLYIRKGCLNRVKA